MEMLNVQTSPTSILKSSLLMGLMKMDTLQRYQQTIYPCASNLVYFMPSGFCGTILWHQNLIYIDKSLYKKLYHKWIHLTL